MHKRWLTRTILALTAGLIFLLGISGLTGRSEAATIGNKTLIVYFSMSGNTKAAAKQIQRYTGADIVRLRRATPYPKGYDNYARVADHERRHNIHPAIKHNLPNLDQYSTILIGFPTWWQRPPMVIHSLFDAYDFRGKIIIPFTTSMSTPMKASMPTMRRLAQNDGATIRNGFRYDDNNAQLRQFLNRNGLMKNN